MYTLLLRIKYIVLSFFLLAFHVNGQKNISIDSVEIYYHGTHPIFNKSFEFDIRSNDQVIKTSCLSENYKVSFRENPGDYSLDVRSKDFHHSCNHDADKIFLRILPYNIKIEEDAVSLSGNFNANGLIEKKTISLTLNLLAFEGFEIDKSKFTLEIVGLNSDIKSKLLSYDKLSENKILVSFELTGKLTAAAYLTFDLYYNKLHVDSYYLTDIQK